MDPLFPHNDEDIKSSPEQKLISHTIKTATQMTPTDEATKPSLPSDDRSCNAVTVKASYKPRSINTVTITNVYKVFNTPNGQKCQDL